ncbi:MAG: hypothetical protein OK454_05325 [Thaumarchaeota archaeon]|nr:hypothetical protein [Nitrososphaerota archaeon]
MQHRQGGHQTDLVVKDEDARRLQVRIVLLRDEAATLKDQLAQKDANMSKLTRHYDDVCAKVDRLGQQCRDQETQLHTSTREHAELKVRLRRSGEICCVVKSIP